MEDSMVHTGLQDKVAIITGANHGIGAATAKALAAEGVAVLINFLRMPPLGDTAGSSNEADPTTPGLAYYNRNRNRSAEEVVQSIRERGGRAEAIEADLSDPATIPFLFERAETLLGPDQQRRLLHCGYVHFTQSVRFNRSGTWRLCY